MKQVYYRKIKTVISSVINNLKLPVPEKKGTY